MASSWLRLVRDKSGKVAYTLALGSCAVATAVASTSDEFELNPTIESSLDNILELRGQFAETLDKATRAMGG